VRALGERLGMEAVIKEIAAFGAEVELVSPAGVAVVGGVVWWLDGRWKHAGFPMLMPEWWSDKLAGPAE